MLKKKLFSLTELLVVVAILAILLSLLSPALRHSLAITRTVGCSHNLKTMYTIALNYEEDYDGRMAACYSGDKLYYDFIYKVSSQTYPDNITFYPGNTSFMTFLQGYFRELPISNWSGGIGDSSREPDAMFDCPAGTGEGKIFGKNLQQVRMGDKRWVNYNNIRHVWKFVNKRHERYPNPLVANSFYGDNMALPMTDIQYASQTLLIVDSKYAAFSGMNQMSSSGILKYNNLHQLTWRRDASSGEFGVRVEHEGAYQGVHFDGSVGLWQFPEVHDSFNYNWLKEH